MAADIDCGGEVGYARLDIDYLDHDRLIIRNNPEDQSEICELNFGPRSSNLEKVSCRISGILLLKYHSAIIE